MLKGRKEENIVQKGRKERKKGITDLEGRKEKGEEEDREVSGKRITED